MWTARKRHTRTHDFWCHFIWLLSPNPVSCLDGVVPSTQREERIRGRQRTSRDIWGEGLDPNKMILEGVGLFHFTVFPLRDEGTHGQLRHPRVTSQIQFVLLHIKHCVPTLKHTGNTLMYIWMWIRIRSR